ncbi:MAG TPA: enoyl-CoA hydratase [Candidatus Sulfotelmatobacter sp.]|nr:enoyl-CoA hydratase [Candidatus Sulfotelmatobacter sp.]
MTDTQPLVSTRYRDHGKDGRVAWLTIEREAKLNTLNPAMLAAVTAAAKALQHDESLRAAVVTGRGERAFVGGADIFTMAKLAEPAAAEAFITSVHQAIAAVRDIPVPVIARVNGYCLGAGLELAAACDLRVAADSAVFGMPEVKVGLPSVIEAALLPRLVGWGFAAELVLLGENIDAATARDIRLVERVVPMAELDAAVDKYLGAILAAGPKAVRIQKDLMRQWEKLPLDQAVQAGIRSFRSTYASGGAEPQEMLGRFVERKRKGK